MNYRKIELNPAQTVLVLGGYGFVGRHIVEQLENFGANVIVGTRGTQSLREPGTRKICLHEIKSADDWHVVLQGVDVVINAVGILRQRWRETYEQVHHLAVETLSQACAKRQIRLVHISVLGLENKLSSRLPTSKRKGEQALMRSDADWRLVRPSLFDGGGGNAAKWFRRLARWPIHIAPSTSTGRLCPVDVNDVGEAIAKIALDTARPESQVDRIYELGGREALTVFEYLQTLSPAAPFARLRLPALFARPLSHLMDLLHLTPFSFGHYEMLKYDNCPAPNRLQEMLGRSPRRIGYGTGITVSHPTKPRANSLDI